MEEDFVYQPWNCNYGLGQDIPPSIGHNTIKFPSEEDVEKSILLKEKFNHIKSKSPEELFEYYSYKYFMMICGLLDVPGELIEEYFCYNFQKLNPKLELGDRRDESNKKNFQFKVSILTATKRDANINHLQKWQLLDEYRIVIIDQTDSYKPHFFTLSRNQMLQEIALLNAHSMNGTKVANVHNRKKYLKLILSCKNSNCHFQRWINNYKKDLWYGAWNNNFSS